nr:MAG TPA: hypothetical protein [Caudoviricetes sp.]
MYKKGVFFCFFIFARKYPFFIHNNTPFCRRNIPPFIFLLFSHSQNKKDQGFLPGSI